MAIIDTLRPTATLSSAGWAVTPSGTADEVTSDDSDTTFVTGDLDSSSLVLSVGPHGVPADHMRHLARVRARGEDGDVVASVRLPSGNQVAFSSISLPSTVGSVNGSWGTGLPPSVAGTYGIVVTAQDDDVNVAELWLDIDSRARPTFTLEVLDAGTPTSVVTTTNTPTLSFETIVLDGLPPRQWRAWVTLGGAIVWDSGIVAGAATTVDTAPLINGSYVAHAQVWSTVGGVNEFPSAEVTKTFSVNVQPVAGPTSINVVQRPGTPLFDITVGIPSGLGDYDDNLAYVEVQRTDCDGEWSTIGLEQVAFDRLIEDFEDTVLAVTLIDSGDEPWARSTDNQHTGAYSLRSGVITNNETSRVTIIIPSGYHTLHFWYSVSSEEGFDYLRMYVDDIEIDIDQFSGEIPWTRKTLDITGATTIAFQYEKDVSAARGSDAAWIDDFIFVGATAETASFVDWTAPRAVTGPECDPDVPCEFQYRTRLVGLKDGVLVTSEWLYEMNVTASVTWSFTGNTADPTIELGCNATPFTGVGLTQVIGSSGYPTDPYTHSPGIGNTSLDPNIYYTGTVDAGAGPPLGTLLRAALLAARGGSSTPRGFHMRTSVDGFTTDVYASALPTQRPMWTSYDFALNVPVTGTGVEVRVYPYVAGAEQDVDFDEITLTFGEIITHTLEWPTSDVLLRTLDASGPLWHSACGDVQWERVRPFTDELGVMGDQKVRSNVPGGRDYTLNLSVTAQEDVEALERIFARQLVLVSPVDLPEQWVGPVSQSVDVLKVKRARSTSIKTIGTGPEPPHSPQEVIG